jgi:glycoprotein-N-acetylgalactosamine 3-beta-galactosyltransferase
MIDVTWINVAGNHTQDPHRGARDTNGIFGYVHDPTALRTNPPLFHYDNLTQGCAIRDADSKVLTEKILVDAAPELASERRKRDKIFCTVYTTEDYHDRIPLIRQTWG